MSATLDNATPAELIAALRRRSDVLLVAALIPDDARDRNELASIVYAAPGCELSALGLASMLEDTTRGAFRQKGADK